MALAKWAGITNEQIVFEIIDFDLFSGEEFPTPNTYIKTGDETPYPTPDLGDIWTGDGFIKP